MVRDTLCTYCWRWKGYTLHVHTSGGGKRYTLHIHTVGGGKDTPCTSILLAVKRIHPAGPYCWQWKGYTFTSIMLAMERDTPCTSILLAVDRDTPFTSILLAVERDTPCTSILLAGWKVMHSAGS